MFKQRRLGSLSLNGAYRESHQLQTPTAVTMRTAAFPDTERRLAPFVLHRERCGAPGRHEDLLTAWDAE